jgi:hypothetical protein
MPSSRPRSAGSRGPIARQPGKAPTGFRIDPRTQFQLQAAALFTGCSTLQSVLELAVNEFLENMKKQAGFRQTLDAAERAQQQRAGVIPLGHKPTSEDDN